MTSHRAMKALAEDVSRINAVARQLLSIGEAGDGRPAQVEWTDWELDFLESLEGRDRESEPLSLRQREKLEELMRAAERHRSLDGFDVASLVRKAWEERLDLEEADAEFLESLKGQLDEARSRGLPFSVSSRKGRRLLRCCQMLGLIEAHDGGGIRDADSALA